MKDTETIEKLYELFLDDIYKKNNNEKEIKETEDDIYNKLWKTLNKNQKRLFDNILKYEAEMANEINKKFFVFAFRLAINLFKETIYDKSE